MLLGPKGIFSVGGQDNCLLFCQAVRQFLKFADSYNFFAVVSQKYVLEIDCPQL